ncbi:kelch-like protein 12 isoform X2 [Hydra vulgaris]|uniref:kelch-like protein 12 isoform X2 n=2 Tax=Hydra vulgaris TaxID=6087 RepID=UPI001F5F322F|nr:kelch-like protein 12 isoform X1 [Hydra vulgaris]XP_047132009.1 kelch-like protein 12 isoform X1 [Hydra vulgaris]
MREHVTRCFKDWKYEMRRIRTKLAVVETTDELFYDDSFSKKLSQRTNHLRKQNILTDVVLLVDDQMFPAHRIILATSGDYFFSMFSGSLSTNEKHIRIHGVSANTMESILSYIYCGSIEISEENVQDILEASALMLLESLKERCGKFLRDRIDEENCLRIFSLSKQFSLSTLQTKTFELITSHFSELCSHPDFQLLDASALIDILSCEEISVPNEDTIFNAALTWFNYDSHQRSDDFKNILKVIHLPFVSIELLKKCKESVSVDNSNIFSLLDSAIELILSRSFNDDCFPENIGGVFPEPWMSARKCEQFVTSIVALGGPTLNIYNFEVDHWTELGKCTPRHCPGLAVLGSSIYVVGGSSEWKRKSSGECFSIESCTWSTISDMNTPRSNFGLVELRGKLYAIGGYDGNLPLRKVEVYDIKTDTWTNIQDMNSPRDGACDVSDGECLYSIGGYDGSRYLTSTDFYDPETKLWNDEKIPQLQEKRQNAMCAYYDAKIYVIGGYYDDHFHKSVEVLDLDQMKWLSVAPLPKPRHYGGASAINGRLFVCGGWSVQFPVSTVDVYSIDEDIWSTISDLPTPTMVRCSTINLHRKLMLKVTSEQSVVNKRKNTIEMLQYKVSSSI